MAIKQTNKVLSAMTIGNPVRNIEPKTIAAVILVVVMGGLWVRVLLRSGSQTASADTKVENVDLVQQENTVSEIAIKTVALPMISGRHDTIAADFFKADRCSAWKPATTSAAPSADIGENQRLFNEMVKAVALEAIIKDTQGKADKACINGTLVTAGSLLEVKVRNETYFVRVVTIEQGRVQLSWKDRLIAIEIPDQKIN
jgi:hypothetical protein